MNQTMTMTTATKTYEGTKRVHAHPMNRGEYNAYRGWEVPADENPDDPGYLVEYLDGGKSNHAAHAGYISWSPKDVFERAYCEVDQGLSFGDALKALKAGQRVARAGWNGKGLSVELQVPDENSKMTLPYIFMNYPATPASETAPANHINAKVPWLASQTDMLAKDWAIVE